MAIGRAARFGEQGDRVRWLGKGEVKCHIIRERVADFSFRVDLLFCLKGYIQLFKHLHPTAVSIFTKRDDRPRTNELSLPTSYRERAQRPAQQGHWGNSKKLLFVLRSSVVGMNRQATDVGRRVRERS